MRTPVVLSWSGGKDSAFALWTLRRDLRFEVRTLLTTLTEEYGRISMHGVREELLDAQAAAAGLPVVKVTIPPSCPNEVYERCMTAALASPPLRGIEHVAFADLFLEDIRAYREDRLGRVGKRCLFPLWGRDTADLAHEVVRSGFRAILCCVDPRHLDGSFAGRPYDERLLADLPEGVDPCGENGEFHTFVHDGPVLREPVHVRVGDTAVRDGFVFRDLLPTGRPAAS